MITAYEFKPGNDCMKKIDFMENELYRKICGQVRIFGQKESARDAGTSKGAKR